MRGEGGGRCRRASRMDAVAEELREEARRLEAHGAAWGGSVERECQEEAGILRACADELSDEQRRRTHGGQPSNR